MRSGSTRDPVQHTRDHADGRLRDTVWMSTCFGIQRFGIYGVKIRIVNTNNMFGVCPLSP